VPPSTDLVKSLEAGIKACRICRDNPAGERLPHEPNPVAVLSASARIAICGQAPGNKVHQSGGPFTDPSGVRLRQWMGVDEDQFYDPARFAIIPMGFCFPGYDRHGSDMPPRKECRETWHDQVFNAMPQLQLKLLIGGSAQAWHLGNRKKPTVTETVCAWQSYGDEMAGRTEGRIVEWPLPHPSWRNTAWLKKNPWFDKELVPELQETIQGFLL